MSKIVIGSFNNKDQAENAIRDLKERNFNTDNISVVVKDKGEGARIAENTGVDYMEGATSGAATGAVTGGALGALGGLLVGIGAIAIPGGFLIGGPIAAALGLTGAAATTVSGAATGAAAGGLIGALLGLGVAKEDAELYQETVNTGGLLLLAQTDYQDNEIQRIFQNNSASQVRVINR